jgi:beta-1,2-mannobiose phosphorylase / 1,2-beta-oligomannan phosphorylase
MKKKIKTNERKKGRHILDLVSMQDKNLLFFYEKTPFALYVNLQEKITKKILLLGKQPIWQSAEKIKPIKIVRYRDRIVFYFSIKKKVHRLEFSLKNILNQHETITCLSFSRASNNPILKPRDNIPWEACYVLNPAAIYLNNKVHFIYRSIGKSGLSVLGYASSQDGIHINERLNVPAFICSGDWKKTINLPHASYSSGASWCGCEDPRLTKIENVIYMTYTAFSSWNIPAGVALTSISVTNFLNKHWDWHPPMLISPLHEMHKNWVIFPEKINGKFAILHSISPQILIDYFDSLDFPEGFQIRSYYHSAGRVNQWDNWVRGVGPPPIKTSEGWLLLYHAMDKKDPQKYKIGAMILDTQDPKKVLYRANAPLLEPQMPYETQGFKGGVIYVCGSIIKNEKIFIYYGSADSVVCAASAKLDTLLAQIKYSNTPHFTNCNFGHGRF